MPAVPRAQDWCAKSRTRSSVQPRARDHPRRGPCHPDLRRRARNDPAGSQDGTSRATPRDPIVCRRATAGSATRRLGDVPRVARPRARRGVLRRRAALLRAQCARRCARRSRRRPGNEGGVARYLEPRTRRRTSPTRRVPEDAPPPTRETEPALRFAKAELREGRRQTSTDTTGEPRRVGPTTTRRRTGAVRASVAKRKSPQRTHKKKGARSRSWRRFPIGHALCDLAVGVCPALRGLTAGPGLLCRSWGERARRAACRERPERRLAVVDVAAGPSRRGSRRRAPARRRSTRAPSRPSRRHASRDAGSRGQRGRVARPPRGGVRRAAAARPRGRRGAGHAARACTRHLAADARARARARRAAPNGARKESSQTRGSRAPTRTPRLPPRVGGVHRRRPGVGRGVDAMALEVTARLVSRALETQIHEV